MNHRRKGRSLIEPAQFEPIHSGQRTGLLYPMGALKVGDTVLFVEVNGGKPHLKPDETGRQVRVLVTDVNPASFHRVQLDLVSFSRAEGAAGTESISAPADDSIVPGDHVFRGPAGALYIYRELSGETDKERSGGNEHWASDTASAGGGAGRGVGGAATPAL